MQTSKDYTTTFRHYGEITVPAGTPLTHKTAMGIDEKIHFVNSYGWIEKNYPAIASILILDVSSYGIDVPVEYVDYRDEAVIAFEKAIDNCRLSGDENMENYAGLYMFMGTNKNGIDTFKHRHTREYLPKSYNVLSPDGFSIHPEDTYPSPKAAREAFEIWKQRYEKQGYYSSAKGRISLDELHEYCKIIPIK